MEVTFEIEELHENNKYVKTMTGKDKRGIKEPKAFPKLKYTDAHGWMKTH